MTAEFPNLFRPIDLGPVRLRNRVAFSAHLTNYATDGMPTDRHAGYYAARAAGGAGLIITEEHITDASDRPYEKLIRGYDEAVLPHYRRLTDAVHVHGTPIFAQLNNNGGQSSGMYTRAAVLGPSAVADGLFREVPHVADRDDITGVITGFVRVARNCADGGFDGVELQCSQSSIIRSFLSRATNRRTDEYGGSLSNRARLLMATVAAVRSAIGTQVALGVRLSGDEAIERGTRLDEAVAVAEMLDESGQVDYINTTMGVATESLHMVEPSMVAHRGYALYVARAVREAVSLPVVGVGRIKTPAEAEQAIRDGSCDLVGVVRGQIADPDFVNKARSGRADEIRRCLSCNQECVGRVGANRALGCVVNPTAGRESEWLPAPTASRSIAVVGAGPAGLEAAATAAQRGHRVTLFESAAETGGQIRLAARVAGRAELLDLVTDLENACRRANVNIRLATTMDAEGLVDRHFDAVVCATGARASRPAWSAESSRVVDVRDVLDRNATPAGRVLVFDELGFHQATSTAEFLAAGGCSVTIATNAMVVGQDLDSTLDVEGWMTRAHRAGIVQLTDVVPIACTESDRALDVRLLHHPTGRESVVTFDWVVCSVHQQPADELWKELQRNGVEVYRVGDAVTPRRASAAVLDGYRVGLEL